MIASPCARCSSAQIKILQPWGLIRTWTAYQVVRYREGHVREQTAGVLERYNVTAASEMHWRR